MAYFPYFPLSNLINHPFEGTPIDGNPRIYDPNFHRILLWGTKARPLGPGGLQEVAGPEMAGYGEMRAKCANVLNVLVILAPPLKHLETIVTIVIHCL